MSVLEGLAVFAVFVAGLAVLALAIRVTRLRLAWLGWCVVAAALVTLAASGVRRPIVSEADVRDRPVEEVHDGYVSSSACQGCHPDQYRSWHRSYHRTMTQVATAETVVAPFDGREVIARGFVYRPYRQDDELWIEMDDPYWQSTGTPPRVRHRVVMTTGSHHEQDYWFAIGPGRAIAHMPLVYRIPEQRWLPNGSTFMQPPPPAVPPRPEVGGWNRNCIQCHATHGRPRFDWPRDVDTRVGELGIACEACHGPGQEHVARNRDPTRRYRLHLEEDQPDTTIVNPARLPHDRASEVCGQCHMLSTVLGAHSHPEWNLHGAAYRPGDRLSDSREIVRPALAGDAVTERMAAGNERFLEDRFWPDGMVRVSGREMQGLLETPCFQKGELGCLSCHVLHPPGQSDAGLDRWADDQLADGMDGDRACLECHGELAAEPSAHTHHAADSEGSRCYNCHMPHTTYGLLKAIRSHQIDSPSVRVELATGRPNACNLCHLDRSLQWTAETLSAWYGQPEIELPPRDGTTAWGPLRLLTDDAGTRALVAWSAGWQPAWEASVGGDDGGRWLVPYLGQLLDDPYEAVRFIAARSLGAIDTELAPGYDFLGSPDHRRALARQLVEGWQSTGAADRMRALVLTDDGHVDRTRFAALLAERDDRRVELRE